MTKIDKEIQNFDFFLKIFFFLILEFTPTPKLEMNIVLNVKKKQEGIMTTSLRVIKPPEVAPMNIGLLVTCKLCILSPKSLKCAMSAQSSKS